MAWWIFFPDIETDLNQISTNYCLAFAERKVTF